VSTHRPSRRELEAGGWKFRFTASEPRLSEHVRDYEELGFEVTLVPLGAEDAPTTSCSPCLESGEVHAIFVRRRE
jgi:hypothetical protein